MSPSSPPLVPRLPRQTPRNTYAGYPPGAARPAAVYGSTTSRPPAPLVTTAPQQTNPSQTQPTSSEASMQPARHQAPTPSPTPTDESIDEASFSNDDCDEDSSDEDFAASKKLRRASGTTNRPCVRWTKDEDVLLMASVQKHGRDWKKVAADFARESKPPRTFEGLSRRYQRLSSRARKQQGGGSAATTSRSAPRFQQQQQRQSTSSTSRSRPTRSYQHWTTEEDDTLATIGKSAPRLKDVYPAWCCAYPATTRSSGSVMTRYDMIVRGTRGLQGVARSGDFEQQAGQRAATSSRATMRSTSAFLLDEDDSPPDYPSHLNHDSNGRLEPNLSRRATMPALSTAASARDGSVNDFQSHDASTFEQATLPVLTDYTINVLDSGLLIRNFPSHLQLHILSPTQIRVVGLDQSSSLSAAAAEASATFIFQQGANGLMQAVKFPPGLTSRLDVKSEPAQIYVDERGQERWCQPEAYIEARFEIEDYAIVFHSVQG